MKLRTATPPELEMYHGDPQGFYDFVSGVIDRAGGELLDLYFDVGEELAYAIVKSLDDYLDVKAVSRILGAEGWTKMITVDQAVEALGREPGYRGTGNP
jgi:predicted RNA-binding protein associated with RNAse of E/G family